MTPEETLDTIGKIFSQINKLDNKLSALETNVKTLITEKGQINKAVEELKALFGDLKIDINKLDQPFQFETCGGYKELRSRVDEMEDRVNSLQQDWKALQKKQTWRLTIAAGVISGLLIIIILAIFLAIVPYLSGGSGSETSHLTDDKLVRLIDALETNNRSNQ